MTTQQNTYTKVPNNIVENLSQVIIPGEAMKILWTIIRKTYGFNKPEDWISLTQFATLTNTKKRNVFRALKKLISMNIVIKTDYGHKITYKINEDTTSWLPTSNQIPVSNLSTTDIQSEYEPASNQIPTNNISTKNNNTKEKELSFSKLKIAEKFVELYTKYLTNQGYACPVKGLTQNRIDQIYAIYTDKPDWEKWEALFKDYIPTSKWLRGEIPPTNNRPQFKMDIDWLIRESTIVKIREGFYHR
jgi:phage replication O-like protein O